MIEPIVHENFSPTILEFQVPDKFVDMVNLVGDAVLGDDKLSKQWDFSDNFVGKVSKEELEETICSTDSKTLSQPGPEEKLFLELVQMAQNRRQ